MNQGNWLHFNNVTPNDAGISNPGTGRTHPTGGAGGCFNLGECQPQQDLLQCSGEKNYGEAAQGLTLIDISCDRNCSGIQAPTAAIQMCSGNQSCIRSHRQSHKKDLIYVTLRKRKEKVMFFCNTSQNC